MNDATIALIISLDTKREEADYAVSVLRGSGAGVFLIDVSTGEQLNAGADVTPAELFASIGLTWEGVRAEGRSACLSAMSRALEQQLPLYYAQGKFQAVLSIGGGQSAYIAAAGMQALPFGTPKILASAIANGARQVGQFVGISDIFVLPTVADIAGLNRITRTVIANACLAALGMAKGAGINVAADKAKDARHIAVAATMLGITTKGVERVLGSLSDDTFEKTCFHANGVGGASMEALIEEGAFDAVLDLTLHEITCELFGGYCRGAVGRLDTAMRSGTPAIVAPGATEVLDFYVDAAGGTPADLEKRKYTWHNENVLHSRLLPEETKKVAAVIATRLNRATGPLSVVLPEKGFSEESAPGMPLHCPDDDILFIETLQDALRPDIRCIRVDANINDPETAEVIVRELLDMTAHM